MTVLTTTGVQSEAHLPFAGLHQLLRPVRGRRPSSPTSIERRSTLRSASPRKVRLSTSASRWPPSTSFGVATDAPLLVVVEDAHWLDRPTADVLVFISRRIESDPIVLLAASRDGYESVLAEAALPEHSSYAWTRRLRPICSRRPLAGSPSVARVRSPAGSRGKSPGAGGALIRRGRTEKELSVPGGPALTKRLEQAFAGRAPICPRRPALSCSSPPSTTRTEWTRSSKRPRARRDRVDLDAVAAAVDAGIVPPTCRRSAFGIRSCARRSPRART